MKSLGMTNDFFVLWPFMKYWYQVGNAKKCIFSTNLKDYQNVQFAHTQKCKNIAFKLLEQTHFIINSL